MRQKYPERNPLVPAGIALLALFSALPVAEGRSKYQQFDALMARFGGAPGGLQAAAACESDAVPMVGYQEPSLCEDLYSFSCSPGKWDDGTGPATDQAEVDEKVARLKRQWQAKAKKEYLELLQKPGSKYLRKIALSAYGLTQAPACRSKVKQAAACDNVLATSLARQSIRNLFPRGPAGQEGRGGPKPKRLRDLDLLLQNAAFRRTETKLSRELKEKLRNPAMERKLEKKIFPRVQKLLASLLRRKVQDPNVAEILATKVEAIEFAGTSCANPTPPDATGKSYDPSLAALLVPNAYYTPADNTFRYCNGFLLQSQSEFQIASVVAHELAHSVDPCLVSIGPEDFRFRYSEPADRVRSEKEYPLPGLVSCLRDERSVGAAYLEPGQGEPRPDPRARLEELRARVKELNREIVKKGQSPEKREELRDEKTLILAKIARIEARLREPGPGPGPGEGEGPPLPDPEQPAFCRDDQIGEAVSDWFSAEIVPEYIRTAYPKLNASQRRVGYSNVFRALCPPGGLPPEEEEFDVHPNSERRTNQLLLANPRVRRQMGCPASAPAGVKYCNVKNRGAR